MIVVIGMARNQGVGGSNTTIETFYRFEAQPMTFPAKFFHCSTQAFSVAEAIALGQLPPRLILSGSEGQKFAAGVGLPPAIERAAGEVATRLPADVQRDA